MTVHGDLVLKARVRLLSHNERILDAPEGLWVYRALFPVSPHVYAYKLAYVLRTAAASPQVAHLPQARRALLEEARAAAAHIPADAPAHQARMWEYTVAELTRLEQRKGRAGQ
ncbi:hypothetical protein P3T27_002625 [Kitasatospora sp. MAA19]|uniref:hypothetical protein n=1 Tax=Kitasatospora sp. MAA19 TaxID=3035090 RepID=UPI002475F733|nr:hypothetical protein [Kitasatospora sp. MAA19]MDH6705903.1 hypothetical protein [Kitasatospora sp. MAA19]